MRNKIATRRYFKIFIPSMLIYVLGVFGVSWAEKEGLISTPMIIVLSIIPALAILAWMWGHWRYVKELDEYIRALQTEAMMIALMVVVAIASSWGLMEFMADVAKLPVFFVMPGFYFIYGITLLILTRRAGIKGICL